MKTLLTVGNIMKLVTELPVAVQLSSAERDAVLFGDYHRDPKVIEAFEHAETIIFKTFPRLPQIWLLSTIHRLLHLQHSM